MKFGKSLNNQIEGTLPEWRDKFLSYKELKKLLKLIVPKSSGDRPNKRIKLDAADDDDDEAVVDSMPKEEIDFIQLLEDQLDKFNTFFLEKEEEFIIRLKDLQDMLAIAKEKSFSEEMMKIHLDVVDFHGEMVLLENYSVLNCTGLAKILKKFDKRTGALIRLPFIQRVLQQPFFTTDLLYKLIKECETMLNCLSLINNPSSLLAADVEEGSNPSTSANNEIPKEIGESEYFYRSHMKSTISALQVLKEIRSGSSTVSVYSFPPLQMNEDDKWKKVPVVEQVAK